MEVFTNVALTDIKIIQRDSFQSLTGIVIASGYFNTAHEEEL